MSLFGSSPPADDSPPRAAATAPKLDRSRSSLFEDEPAMTRSSTSALFQDDDSAAPSPWDLPTPRKQQSRRDVVRDLLPSDDVPDSYVDAFDAVLRRHPDGAGRVSAAGVASTLAAGSLAADARSRILNLVAGGDEDAPLGRGEFNVLLALIGLAQEGEALSLDGVDERRRDLPQPKLPGLVDKTPAFPRASELAAKPPQRPVTPMHDSGPTVAPPRETPRTARKVSLDYADDPWNTPDLHKNHSHAAEGPGHRTNGSSVAAVNGDGAYDDAASAPMPPRTTSAFSTTGISGAGSARPSTDSMSGSGVDGSAGVTSPAGGWEYFPTADAATGAPYGGATGGRAGDGSGSGSAAPGPDPPATGQRSVSSSGRTGNAIEENVLVTLMPEKEGMFMFQHHNYEVTSARRGSKVVRRYSDFVWLLDCLHKRYPFRVLPLLPPKRVAVNGNHLSNDGAFIEKRRRGLARFLNALVRHPTLGQEQLVVMFLTVPTELSVWRKQANLSVQDEFTGRSLPAGLEDSLSPGLDELFERTRSGVRRSAELYIGLCGVVERLVKRTEGVAADHGRVALALGSLAEASADVYASDASDVPLLNDGLGATGTHLRRARALLDDESKAWDEGVLEDLKRQRDALVGVRDLFDRRERLDRDNIPYLERRIQTNETKLAGLRAKPDGLVKPGEIDKVVEAIIKDKESIVNQHNRSVFVKECIRDELLVFQSTQYHVTRWNQDWAQERVKYSEMMADNWRRLLDELEGMPTGD